MGEIGKMRFSVSSAANGIRLLTFHVNWPIPLGCGNRHASGAFYFASRDVPLRHALSRIFRKLVCVRATSAADSAGRTQSYAIPFPMC